MANNETKIVITAATAQAEAALKSFTGQFKSMIGVVGGALSVGAFANLIESSIDLQDELGSLSAKTGISAKDLGGLKFAADQNGASLELVAKAVRELSVNMADTPDKFARLGINATDATDALTQIADIVEMMPEGMEKTALLAELMGKKVGPEMAEFLSQGGAALREWIAKGKEVYRVTDEGAANAKEFNDRLNELKASATGLGVAITKDLLPVLNDMIKGVLGTTGDKLKDLNIELTTVRRRIQDSAGGGALQRWLYGSADELKKREQELLASIAKVREEAAKQPPSDKPKTVPKAVTDLLNADQKNGLEVLRALERDYQGELARRKDALNAPLLSASEKQLAEDLRAVEKRAQDARVALENQKVAAETQGRSFVGYRDRLAEITAEEEKQKKAITELQAAQDALNQSFSYGAKTALREYLDEVQNTAKQSKELMSASFKGMEDAIAKFYRNGSLSIESLKNVILDMLAQIAAKKTMSGLIGLFGGGGGGNTTADAGLATYLEFAAKGNVYGFANGGAFTNGLFSSPTAFKFANGAGFSLGVMGEAGPEAVMPLARGPDGKLGVRSQGGGGLVFSPTYVIHADSATDISKFRKIAEDVSRQGNAELVDTLQRQRML